MGGYKAITNPADLAVSFVCPLSTNTLCPMGKWLTKKQVVKSGKEQISMAPVSLTKATQ